MTEGKKLRGFALLDPSRLAEIASRGGKAAHANGTAHQFTEEEARAAGKKGGLAPHVRRGPLRKSESERAEETEKTETSKESEET